MQILSKIATAIWCSDLRLELEPISKMSFGPISLLVPRFKTSTYTSMPAVSTHKDYWIGREVPWIGREVPHSGKSSAPPRVSRRSLQAKTES
jgi:hypothetical protein